MLLIVAAASPVFAVSFTTESFHTTLDVQENSSMHVTEIIKVNFEGSAHGIYRDIWTLDKCWIVKDGELIETDMLYKLKNFECEGEKIKKSTETDYVSIRIGSADVTVTGPHTYKLEYDVVMYKDSLDDMDQLYWNILPMYWETGVDEFTYTIHMPKEFDADKLEIISGPIGDGDTSRAIYTVNGTTVEGRMDGPMEYGGRRHRAHRAAGRILERREERRSLDLRHHGRDRSRHVRGDHAVLPLRQRSAAGQDRRILPAGRHVLRGSGLSVR